jgi:hypothetical protein
MINDHYIKNKYSDKDLIDFKDAWLAKYDPYFVPNIFKRSRVDDSPHLIYQTPIESQQKGFSFTPVVSSLLHTIPKNNQPQNEEPNATFNQYNQYNILEANHFEEPASRVEDDSFEPYQQDSPRVEPFEEDNEFAAVSSTLPVAYQVEQLDHGVKALEMAKENYLTYVNMSLNSSSEITPTLNQKHKYVWDYIFNNLRDFYEHVTTKNIDSDIKDSLPPIVVNENENVNIEIKQEINKILDEISPTNETFLSKLNELPETFRDRVSSYFTMIRNTLEFINSDYFKVHKQLKNILPGLLSGLKYIATQILKLSITSIAVGVPFFMTLLSKIHDILEYFLVGEIDYPQTTELAIYSNENTGYTMFDIPYTYKILKEFVINLSNFIIANTEYLAKKIYNTGSKSEANSIELNNTAHVVNATWADKIEYNNIPDLMTLPSKSSSDAFHMISEKLKKIMTSKDYTKEQSDLLVMELENVEKSLDDLELTPTEREFLKKEILNLKIEIMNKFIHNQSYNLETYPRVDQGEVSNSVEEEANIVKETEAQNLEPSVDESEEIDDFSKFDNEIKNLEPEKPVEYPVAKYEPPTFWDYLKKYSIGIPFAGLGSLLTSWLNREFLMKIHGNRGLFGAGLHHNQKIFTKKQSKKYLGMDEEINHVNNAISKYKEFIDKRRHIKYHKSNSKKFKGLHELLNELPKRNNNDLKQQEVKGCDYCGGNISLIGHNSDEKELTCANCFKHNNHMTKNRHTPRNAEFMLIHESSNPYHQSVNEKHMKNNLIANFEKIKHPTYFEEFKESAKPHFKQDLEQVENRLKGGYVANREFTEKDLKNLTYLIGMHEHAPEKMNHHSTANMHGFAINYLNKIKNKKPSNINMKNLFNFENLKKELESNPGLLHRLI